MVERKINLNFRPNKHYLSTGEYFKRAARRLGIKVDKNYTGMVLNIESGFPTPYKTGTVTGIYEIDIYQDQSNPHMDQIKKADVYFSTHVPKRRIDDYVLLPHGFDPVLCNANAKKEYDIVLSGTTHGSYANRRHIYELVSKEFKCLSVGDKTPTPVYLKQLSKAKIILNVTGWKEMNRRVFDGMAMGVALVDDCPNTYLLGDKGIHFVTFRDDKDVVDVIRNLLDDENYYNKIREAGRDYAFENHTYDIRLAKAFNKLKEVYHAKVH